MHQQQEEIDKSIQQCCISKVIKRCPAHDQPKLHKIEACCSNFSKISSPHDSYGLLRSLSPSRSGFIDQMENNPPKLRPTPSYYEEARIRTEAAQRAYWIAKQKAKETEKQVENVIRSLRENDDVMFILSDESDDE